MIFFLVLLVTLIEAAQPFGGAEQLGQSEKTVGPVFTAKAFICNPDFTPSSKKLLTNGSILFVCIEPAKDQISTVITKVNYFCLNKVDEDLYFEAVYGMGETSKVTVVIGLDTREVIIGVRVPSQFYDTDTEVTGIGEVMIGQQRLSFSF